MGTHLRRDFIKCPQNVQAHQSYFSIAIQLHFALSKVHPRTYLLEVTSTGGKGSLSRRSKVHQWRGTGLDSSGALRVLGLGQHGRPTLENAHIGGTRAQRAQRRRRKAANVGLHLLAMSHAIW